MSDQCLLPEFKTVVSKTQKVAIGQGVTRRKGLQRLYFYAWREVGSEIFLQPLSKDWLPMEHSEACEEEVFFNSFVPEPLIFHNKFVPAMMELNRSLERGDLCRRVGRLEEAAKEFNMALALSPKNIRATFGMGLVSLDMNQTENAANVFSNLLEMEAAFSPAYKHLFNEFGIKLRQKGLFREALDFYGRAVELSGGDDHLFFNIARVLYDMGRLGRCHQALDKALGLNPRFTEALSMLGLVEEAQASV